MKHELRSLEPEHYRYAKQDFKLCITAYDTLHLIFSSRMVV